MCILGILSAGLLASGCRTAPPPANSNNKSVADTPRPVVDGFRIGDGVVISFSGATGTEPPIQLYKEAVKDDGTITPPHLKPMVAAGKTPGQLQKQLQDKYDETYQNLTVTVIASDRYFYITGEVRKPGPEPYLGETDIIKAISAAQDFTDFANKKKVRLTRANGHTQIINVKKVLDDPQLDVPVYPGDKIYVPRRIF
jgi:polysaccharide export outer membrane protein